MDNAVSFPEFENTWRYMYTPPYVFMAWYFVKDRDKFTCKGKSPCALTEHHAMKT